MPPPPAEPDQGQNPSRPAPEASQAHASEPLLRQLLESAPDGILVVDSRGRICLANQQIENIFGYRRQELLGQPIEMLIPERFRHHHTEQRSDYAASPRPRPMGLGLDLRGRRQDGTEVPVEISLSPLSHGGQIQVVAIVRDVTAHKQVEAALRQQAAELARSNADLEQFATVASHDLQEPLRMVAAYCELLRRKYQGRLDAEADQYIHFAVEGARRMQRLINGVLTYARLGGHDHPPRPVDLNHALVHAQAGLAAIIQESGATISADPLPTVLGREEELVLLLQHLLSNALKFRDQQTPRIHVGVGPLPSQYQLTIRDNGIGIDPRHLDRIFQMFQRLHARGVYPGEGIGLAVCKKIVEQHGGRIWLESTPGQGTTVSFTLPQPETTQ